MENSTTANRRGLDSGASAADHVVEAPAGICGKPVGQPVGIVLVLTQKQEELHVSN